MLQSIRVKGVELALILSGVLLSVCAQLLLKAGTNAVGSFALTPSDIAWAASKLAVEPRILVAVFCYFLSMLIWILALSRVEVSVAYPMLSLGYFINAAAAWLLFGEPLTPSKLGGIALIVLGVFILARE